MVKKLYRVVYTETKTYRDMIYADSGLDATERILEMYSKNDVRVSVEAVQEMK